MGWALLSIARLWGFLVAGLLLAWAFYFKASFLPHSASAGDGDGAGAGAGDENAISQLDHIYSALHPLLMVIGFILLNGEAILVHRRLAGWSRETRKAVQLSLQVAALGFGLFGIWVKFRGNEGISANFYSLHSWIGLACVALFASQWVVGFISMWHKPEVRWTRSVVHPWHMFVGLYAFGLAVAAAETGLQEKLTFLLGRRGLAHNSLEAALINSLGIALALLAAVVILAAISPRHNVSRVTKFVNVKDDMNGKLHV